MSVPRSSLITRPTPLAPYLLVAVVGHLSLVAALVLADQLDLSWSDDGPLFDPDDVIEVSMVSVPQSESLPTRATRRAAPRAPEPPPTPPPEAPEQPPPPRQSDLAVQTPEAEPTPQAAVPDDSTRKMDDLMDELRMDDLMDELRDADDGPVDRNASSPDGDPDATASRVMGSGVGDPEIARYIARLSDLFDAEFRPLPALRGKGLSAAVLVRVDSAGTIVSRRLETPSGNPSWDQSALAAVDLVGAVPAPPAKLGDASQHAYRILFEDS